MLRSFAAVIVLSCFSTSAWTQVQPTPPVAGTEATQPAAKPAIRKPAARSEPAGKQASGSSGPCGLGVIVVVGDEFTVKTIGLTVFQSKETVVPINWGLEDLIFARVRAAGMCDLVDERADRERVKDVVDGAVPADARV